jgi:hypothetical protein
MTIARSFGGGGQALLNCGYDQKLAADPDQLCRNVKRSAALESLCAASTKNGGGVIRWMWITFNEETAKAGSFSSVGA